MGSVQHAVGSDMQMRDLKTMAFRSIETEMLGEMRHSGQCVVQRETVWGTFKKCLLSAFQEQGIECFIFIIHFNFCSNYCYPYFSDEETKAEFKEPSQNCTANKRQVCFNAKFMLLTTRACLLLKADLLSHPLLGFSCYLIPVPVVDLLHRLRDELPAQRVGGELLCTSPFLKSETQSPKVSSKF